MFMLHILVFQLLLVGLPLNMLVCHILKRNFSSYVDILSYLDESKTMCYLTNFFFFSPTSVFMGHLYFQGKARGCGIPLLAKSAKLAPYTAP
ncbi:hypothetical protein Hdeb2414_s0009g00325661 [Helianthus debilis subsp. tardiflorus]